MKYRGIIWLIFLALGLGVCLCSLLIAGFLVPMRNNTSVSRSTTLMAWPAPGVPGDYSEQVEARVSVRGPVRLRINDPAGDVTIQTGPADQVTMHGVKHVWAAGETAAHNQLAVMRVDVRQAGGEIRVDVSGLGRSNPSLRTPRVDLVITVPVQTAVTADVALGKLALTGTQGDVNIRGSVGEVQLTNVTPQRSLQVQTGVAAIAVDGPLAAGAHYGLTSDVGRINVKAPADSAFKLDARSDVGSVGVEFALVGSSDREGVIGQEARGTVGSAPTTDLSLHSRVGNIAVQISR